MVVNKLKERLARGETAIGTFIASGSPDLVEILGLTGFHFVVIDCEHSFYGPEKIQHMIRAAELRGITPIIRIPNAMEFNILHVLDVGAHGIQVPQVNDAQTAREIVAHAKYSPAGRRGIVAPRAADYGMTNLTEYFSYENEQTMIITHCENQNCLDNLEEICQIPEIDVVFLGPYDMSQSLGILGQVTHEKIEDAAKRVLEITRKYNKIAGIYTGSGAQAKERARQGFRYIAVSTDTFLFADKYKQEYQAFQD